MDPATHPPRKDKPKPPPEPTQTRPTTGRWEDLSCWLDGVDQLLGEHDESVKQTQEFLHD